MAVAFVANLESKPQYLAFFALYFAGVRLIPSLRVLFLVPMIGPWMIDHSSPRGTTQVGFVIFLMFKRVQLLQLLLFFGPPVLAGPLKAYLKSVRSDKV